MRIVAKLVMARDFWRKRLSRTTSLPHTSPPVFTAILRVRPQSWRHSGDASTWRPSLASEFFGGNRRGVQNRGPATNIICSFGARQLESLLPVQFRCYLARRTERFRDWLIREAV